MKTILLPLTELIPYATNAREHSDEQITQIAESILEFGFTNPILVDEYNHVIAGHGRIKAAAMLEIDAVPCVVLDGLSAAQKQAYILADNKLAMNADWNMDLLKAEMVELQNLQFDLTVIGFDLDEINEIFFEPNFEPGTAGEQGALDELAEKLVTCPHCGQGFDANAT